MNFQHLNVHNFQAREILHDQQGRCPEAAGNGYYIFPNGVCFIWGSNPGGTNNVSDFPFRVHRIYCALAQRHRPLADTDKYGGLNIIHVTDVNIEVDSLKGETNKDPWYWFVIGSKADFSDMDTNESGSLAVDRNHLSTQQLLADNLDLYDKSCNYAVSSIGDANLYGDYKFMTNKNREMIQFPAVRDLGNGTYSIAPLTMHMGGTRTLKVDGNVHELIDYFHPIDNPDSTSFVGLPSVFTTQYHPPDYPESGRGGNCVYTNLDADTKSAFAYQPRMGMSSTDDIDTFFFAIGY